MIIIDIGDFDRREVYRGESVFRAGLAAARAERDRGIEPRVGFYDEDGVDVGTDGLSDDEHDFLSACVDIGARRAARRAS
jgi:hypothetical protein